MTNKTIARKRKAVVARLKKVGSASLGVSLLLGGSPALAASGAFASMASSGGGGFSGLQHHTLPAAADLVHATVNAVQGGSHFQNAAINNTVNTAHLHATGQQISAGNFNWQQGGAIAATVLPTVQRLSIGGGSLDLQSSAANVMLGAGMFNGAASATISVGGVNQVFHPGQKVTAAEYVALTEVLGAGGQTLTLNSSGVAVGGDFNLNGAGMTKAVSIVIPAGVTALDNLATSSTFSLRGDLLNYGSLLAYSTSASVTSGTLTAKNIVNEAGGLISAQSQSATSPTDLTLVATNNFSNAGTIVADGSLNLVSGSGNFANSGLVKSAGGNINLSTINDNVNINIASTAQGSFQAQSGDINIRNAAYNGGGNVNLTGGDYLSQNLNIYSGTGAINGSVGQISGSLNSQAAVEHLRANTSNLVLGQNTVDGDPTFINNGNITISGVNTFTEDVAIIANGNITSANGAQIIDHGHNVILLAGVAATGTPSTATVTTGASGTSGGAVVDFASASNKGGDINFSVGAANTPIDTSGVNTNGGSVTLAAFANAGTGGAVRFDGASTITTTSTSSNGGNVTVIAGGVGTVVQTINLGNITTSGGGAAGTNSAGRGGAINITTAQPTGASGTKMTFDDYGTITDNSIVAGTKVTSGSVNIGGTLNTAYNSSTVNLGVSGGAVNIYASGNVTVAGILTNGGNGSNVSSYRTIGGAGGNGGTVSLQAGAGSVTVAGDINTSGGAGGDSTGDAVGAVGGAGGGVAVTAATTASLQNVALNGGIGGKGGSNSENTGIYFTGGAGGSGGVGGTFSLVVQGSSLSLGSVSANGGNGNTGGTGSIFPPGDGGGGGTGGNGGGISIAAPNATNIYLNGSLSVNAGAGGTGGAGGDGIQTGPNSGLNGGNGARGGRGGSGGTITVITPNAFINVSNSSLLASAAGGAPGAGGAGGAGSLPGSQPTFAAGYGASYGFAGAGGTVTEVAANFTNNFNVLAGSNAAGGFPSVNGTVALTGAGTVLNAITAATITIKAPAGSNGSIVLAAPLSADGALTLASDGTGSLSTNGQTLSAATFDLTNTNGDINTSLSITSSYSNLVSLAAPNGSITASFQGSPTLQNVAASGAVTLQGSSIGVGSGGTISGSSVTINAPAGSDLVFSMYSSTSKVVATSGDIKFIGAIGNQVNIGNAGLIQSQTGNITITSTAAASNTTSNTPQVAISGGGTMQVGAAGTITITADPGSGNPGLAANSVYFFGSQHFIGNTVINAKGPNGLISLNYSSAVTSDKTLTFNTGLLSIDNSSSVSGNPFVLNSGSGAGVIASSGNLDLSSLGNLTFVGQNLAILAAGSITDNNKAVSISTANTNGAGGSVTIVGGFTFSSSPFAGPNYTNPDTTDTFTLTGVNSASTSINLAHTTIDSSGSTSGGNVSVYGVGSVALGAITSKGADNGGQINISGNGINIGGNIDVSSSNGQGGGILMYSAPAFMLGTVNIANGTLYGGSLLAYGATANLLTHSINADGKIFGGKIALVSGGTSVFNIGSTAKTNVNGVSGTLSASGPNGTLNVYSFSSGITNASPLNNFQTIYETASKKGDISLGSSLSKNTQLRYVYIGVADGKLTETGSFAAAQVSLGATKGDIGTKGVGFAVNTPLLYVGAGGLINITDANADVTIAGFNAGTTGKFVGGGNITTTTTLASAGDLTITAGKAGSISLGDFVTGGGKTALTAGGAGTITGTATKEISGASVVLASKTGAIGSASNPLYVKTSNLTETTTGSTYLTDTSPTALTFNGSNTTGALSLTANGAVTIAKTIAKAASIDIETSPTVVGDIILKAAIGGTATNSIVLAANASTSAISGTGAIVSKNGGSITLSTGGGAIGTGAVGATTAVKVSTGNLKVTTVGTGQVNLINTATYAGTLAASTSGGDFDLKTAQATTLSGISAGGNINVLVGAGTLTTAKNSIFTTGEGNVLLEEVATSGKIMVNTGTVISTHSTSTTGGNVVLSIGAPPTTVAAGTTPANVTVNNVSGGSAFFGTGITANANGGANVVNLKGSNVTFNVGKATAKIAAIVLDGDVTITADPVVVSGTVGAAVPGVVSGAGQLVHIAPSVVANATPSEVSVAASVPVSVGLRQAVDISTSAAVGQSNLASRAGSFFVEPGWISETELSTGEIPAAISSGVDLGIKSNVSAVLDMEEIGGFDGAESQVIYGKQGSPLVGAISHTVTDVKVLKLKRGSVVFAPLQNTMVQTPVGDVKIAAHSLVMVMVFDQGVAVYNLHDRHTGAVAVSVAGEELKLAPGAASIIVSKHVKSFADVNPAQLIGYSNLRERATGGAYKVYSGQFSLIQAMSVVLPLRQLMSANNVEAKKLSAKVLKTSAIMHQIGSRQFEQVLRPVRTAWGN